MLMPQHCDLFDRPFFQFAQMKKYAPETIDSVKTDYRAAWLLWRQTIVQAAGLLAQKYPQFAAPHIERWCNGWQVRAHFFAYFKYARHAHDAPILSVLLNRRRLTVSLDWHCYKAAQSSVGLAQYNRWPDALDGRQFADFDLWHGDESEYADYLPLHQWQPQQIRLRSADDFFCIGKHRQRDELDGGSAAWIAAQIETLLPLYECCFDGFQAA